MPDLLIPGAAALRQRHRHLKPEMALDIPRIGRGSGAAVPRDSELYPSWMFSGRVSRADAMLGADYAPGALADPSIAARNPRRWENSDLKNARTIRGGGTLNETHVNLESRSGQWVKQALDLPYQDHSRVDPQAAALQAFRTFQQSPEQFVATPARFSAADTVALTQYKGFGFGSINRALRTDPAALSRSGRQAVNQLDQLTHAGRVERPFSVHRGFHHPALTGEGSLVGREFTDPGFISTSLNPYVPDEFARTAQDFTAEIRLPQGSHGLPLAAHDTWKQGDKEAEYLLPRNTRFKVLEEHAAESVHRPRHLVLEAITPEHAPTPLALGRRAALEVSPSVAGAASTAWKLAQGETEHALHVNLEGGVGQFLKRLFKLPFQTHSRVDPAAAAVQAQGQPGFRMQPPGHAGILPVGDGPLGSAWHRPEETRAAAVTTAPGPPPPGSARTTVHLKDAPLDRAQVDRMYAAHVQRGYVA